LSQQYLNLLHDKEGMLNDWALVNDLDEIDNVLVFGLANVIINLEELLHVLKLSIVLNKALEYALILLVCYANEVLSL
jgi:hypothetical protein